MGRDRIKLIVAGKVVTGFNIVKLLALGADACNAARAFMFSLGCIQALKCNTNKCPTGVATTNPELASGLDPSLKSHRVYSYHHRTVHSAQEIIGAAGCRHPTELNRGMIFRRGAE